MKSTPSSGSTFSIRKLRTLFLIALVAGLSIYTAIMLSLVTKLSERFGPQVQADLEWRALRGAAELSKTADLGLAMSDAETVKEAFGAYAQSSDVQAIVALDPAGKPVAQHGAFADTASVLAAKPGELVHGPGYLASWAPAAIEGNEVGKIIVVVSTARMTSAQEQLSDVSRTTLVAGLVGLALGLVVILFFTRAVTIRDQQLNDYAHNLEKKVDERTRELDERNRGMRLVLDNVAQGFITIDTHGVMSSERSAIVERWFGATDANVTFGQMIAAHDPAFVTWFELGLESVRDDVLPAELCIDQLPKRFTAGERTFDVGYQPIFEGDKVQRMLLIVSDVSAEIERERSQREQAEILDLFQRIASDRGGFEEFFDEAAALVEQLRTPSDAVTEKRVIHTLKGNCGIYGIQSFAAVCHEIENQLAESGAPVSDEQRATLLAGWAAVCARVEKLLGERKAAVVEVPRDELQRIVQRVRQGVSTRDLAATLEAWAHEPVAVRFERLARHATSLARRLGKAELAVEIEDQGVRLDPKRWIGFWGAMVHATRNAVDHGIETPTERETKTKPSTATLSMRARRHTGRLAIVLADDGGGIDWEAVRAKAEKQGLPAETQDDLIAALFADGMSTREQATETSGRGVGLGALRAAVEELGGTITVSSTRHAGTTFTFVVPDPDHVKELRPPTQPVRKVG